MFYVVGVENGTRITYSPAFVYRWEAQEWMENFVRANVRHWTANRRNVRCEIENR